MVLEVVLVVLGVVLRQCSEQMFGTDSVRNSVPSQLRSIPAPITFRPTLIIVAEVLAQLSPVSLVFLFPTDMVLMCFTYSLGTDIRTV